MKVNTMKKRLMEGETAIGVEAAFGSPIVSEVISLTGFDFVMVDCQHGAFDDTSAAEAFYRICAGSATPAARVRFNDYSAIGRLLDRGALGIIVPLVNSREEAEAAAYAVRFPPRGGRSQGARVGMMAYGDDYNERIDAEVYLAVQIESIQAVEQAEEIMSVEGVDGCMVGPTDLSRSMGIDLSKGKDAEAHEEAILHVLDVCRRLGKIPGIAPGRQGARRWLDAGFKFLLVTNDLNLLVDSARELLYELKKS